MGLARSVLLNVYASRQHGDYADGALPTRDAVIPSRDLRLNWSSEMG